MARAATSRREHFRFHPPKRTTPQALREFRADLGCTQEQLALALGVSHRGYQNWEEGQFQAPGLLTLALRQLSFKRVQQRSVARKRKRDRLLAESLQHAPPVDEKYF